MIIVNLFKKLKEHFFSLSNGPYSSSSNDYAKEDKLFDIAISRDRKYNLVLKFLDDYVLFYNGNYVKKIILKHVHLSLSKISDRGDILFVTATFDNRGANVSFIPLDGSDYFQKHIPSGVKHSSISILGDFLAIETFKKKYNDSNKIIVFDTKKQIEISSFTKPEDMIDLIFDEDNNLLIEFDLIGTHKVDIEGKFIDEKSYLTAKWGKGNYKTIISMAERKMKKSRACNKEINHIDSYIMFLSNIYSVEKSESWDSRYFRVFGEYCDQSGRYSDALCLYEMALHINPKVGIRKRYAYLSKRYPKKFNMPYLEDIKNDGNK